MSLAFCRAERHDVPFVAELGAGALQGPAELSHRGRHDAFVVPEPVVGVLEGPVLPHTDHAGMASNSGPDHVDATNPTCVRTRFVFQLCPPKVTLKQMGRPLPLLHFCNMDANDRKRRASFKTRIAIGQFAHFMNTPGQDRTGDLQHVRLTS